MDWSNESYVRIYTRDTTNWLKCRWEGQMLFTFILRKVDRAGRLDGIEDPVEDLSLVTGIPPEIVEVGLKRILKREFITIFDGTLVVPNFIEAQEATKSDRQRQKESRERRRLAAMNSKGNGDGRGKKESPYTADFERFWERYPKKVGKAAAFRHWQSAKKRKIIPDIDTIIDILEKHKLQPFWKAGKVYKPENWIKDAHWDDEIDMRPVQENGQPSKYEKNKDLLDKWDREEKEEEMNGQNV